MSTTLRLTALTLTLLICCSTLAGASVPPNIATFSVVAYDPATGEVGVAVQSRFFAVGSVVPWCKAGVGAVATQAFAQPEYGPGALDLLENGMGNAPYLVLDWLIEGDEKRAQRQIGLVGIPLTDDRDPPKWVETYPPFPENVGEETNGAQSSDGAALTYTGSECLNWAGGIARVAPDGVVYAVQGNILAGPEVVEAMAAAMDNPAGIVLPGQYNNGQVGIALNTPDFAGRLLSVLVAGQLAGGDSRGMQSAALKVSQAGAGYGGYNDVKYDLRVDDAADPFIELARLLNLARPIALTNQGYTLLNNGSIEQAIAVFTDLATLQPNEASHHYNLACGLARASRGDEAMEQLTAALQLDAKLKGTAKSDTDLESLREREDWEKVVGTP